MTIRALTLGAILVTAGLAAGALGTSPETALWAALVALMGWAVVRFVHWRSGLRRIAAGPTHGPLGRNAPGS